MIICLLHHVDKIFAKDQSTCDLYMDFAKPIVLSVMEGYNGTVNLIHYEIFESVNNIKSRIVIYHITHLVYCKSQEDLAMAYSSICSINMVVKKGGGGGATGANCDSPLVKGGSHI